MFRLLALLVAMFAFANQVQAAPEDDKYTTKYDSVNVEEIITNDRLFDSYFKCLMEEGRCTADGQTLRDVLPDALKTACSKCSDKQKAGIEKVFKFLLEKKPAHYKKLAAKYDPEGVYQTKYEAEAQKMGIKI